MVAGLAVLSWKLRDGRRHLKILAFLRRLHCPLPDSRRLNNQPAFHGTSLKAFISHVFSSPPFGANFGLEAENIKISPVKMEEDGGCDDLEDDLKVPGEFCSIITPHLPGPLLSAQNVLFSGAK